MCPLEAQEGETGWGELYGAIPRRASDGDRWVEIARANEHEKKKTQRQRGEERGGTEPPPCASFLSFNQLQVFNTPAVLCNTRTCTHTHSCLGAVFLGRAAFKIAATVWLDMYGVWNFLWGLCNLQRNTVLRRADCSKWCTCIWQDQKAGSNVALYDWFMQNEAFI